MKEAGKKFDFVESKFTTHRKLEFNRMHRECLLTHFLKKLFLLRYHFAFFLHLFATQIVNEMWGLFI